MRVIIIGLDGLEETLITPERYPNICQVEHGRINLKGFDQVQTPQIWTSFMTGVMPEVHGIDGFKNYTFLSKIEKKYGGYIKRVVSLFGPGMVSWITNIKNSFYERGNVHPYESYTKDDINVPTIFDKFPNSHVISLPVYNEPPFYMDVRKVVAEAINDPELTEHIASECLMMARSEMGEFTKYLYDDLDILMVHLFVSDVYGHLYGDERLLDLYDFLEVFVGIVNKDSLVIIVSDHGTKKGNHTPYGFYSLSKPLGLNNPHMTEFHDIIMEEIK